MSWIIINLIEAMLLACFITTFLKNKKDKRRKYFIALTVSTFIIITISNYISFYDILLTTFVIIGVISISWYFTNNTLDEIVFVACFESLYTGIICISTIILDIYFSSLIMSIIRQILYGLVLLIIRKLLKNINFQLSKELNYILAIIIYLMHFILQIFIQVVIYFNNRFPELILLILVLCLLSLALILLFLKIVDLNIVENKYKQLQKDKRNEQTITTLYEQLKITKHDLKHDYQLISHYLNNHDYEKIKMLMQDKTTEIENIPVLINTKNQLINAIINNKIIEADIKQIKVFCNINIKSTINIIDYDLYELLSNLLDNAIENGKEVIEVTITQDMQFLFVKIVNVIDSSKAGGNLKSKKGKGHGYGLKSVSKIVDKYNGTIDIDNSDKFIIKISLVLN